MPGRSAEGVLAQRPWVNRAPCPSNATVPLTGTTRTAEAAARRHRCRGHYQPTAGLRVGVRLAAAFDELGHSI
jgi:hypothetical protein